MQVEIISDRQGISVMFLFLLGSNLLLGTAAAAQKDIWLATLLGMAMGLILVIVFLRLIYLFPDKDIFQINQVVFGKVIGKIISLAYVIFATQLAILITNTFSNFTSDVILTRTPRVVPTALMMLLTIWVTKEGIEVLGRGSEFFIIILLFILSFATLLSIPNMKPDNIRPVLYGGLGPLIKGTINAFFLPFGDSIIFMMIFSSFKTKKSPFKIYFTSFLLCGFILSEIGARNVMVVGAELLSKNFYPSYMVIARINIGEFIQRIETVIMVSFIVASFVRIACCILAACRGIASIFNFADYRFITYPLALSVLTLSFKAFNNMSESRGWISSYMPLYKSVFEVGIPVITWLLAEVKRYFKVGLQ